MTNKIENPKNNLVKYFSNNEQMKAYLHPKKRSTLELLKYAYGPLKGKIRLKLLMVVHAFSEGLLPIISAFIIYFLVDLLSSENADISNIIKVSIIYGLIYAILSTSANQIYYRTYTIFNRLRMDFLHKCFLKEMKMDFALWEKPDFLSEISRLYHAFSSNEQGLEGSYHRILKLGGEVVSFLILGGLLFFLSPIIFFLSFLGIFIFVKLKILSANYKHKRVDTLNKLVRRLNAYNREGTDFRHGKDLRLYSFKDRFLKAYKPILETYINYYRQYTKPEAYIAPITAFTIVGIEALAYYYLTDKLINREITLGLLSLFISGVSLFIVKVNEIALSLSFINEEMMYFQDGIDFIEADLNSKSGTEIIEEVETLSIEFKDVSFSYPGHDKLVLENLSFKIEGGERISLVGINGAGKSTVVKLITGLLKPTSGKIYINGIDSEEIDIKSRFDAFSVVLQEVEPLAMSIAENVSAKIEDIDREKVSKCLDLVGLYEKINRLDKGIDTQMTKVIHDDGTLFSGGENQKLAIARALYKETSKVLIMDEPTASLDALAEEKIYKAIDKIVGDKTLIFISHRLASTKFCDKIALLDGGFIREYGSHEELMAMNGLYKNMYETQGKYYKAGDRNND